MKKRNFTYIMALLFACLLVCCQKEDSENKEALLFELSETSLTFPNTAGEQKIEVTGTSGDPTVKIETSQSDWCTAMLAKENGKTILSVSVGENIKIKSRRAIIEVAVGEQKRSLLILQSQKRFETIAAVKELVAQPAPGEVILTWEEPMEDNFDHIVISVFDKKNNEVYNQILKKGTTSYTVSGLLSSAGEYLFRVQSFDIENEAGETTEVHCSADKKISFKFKQIPSMHYVGYYFKNNDEVTSTFSIGSNEYNENEKVTISLGIDPSLIDDFNKKNEMKLTLMPAEAYTLADIVYNGTLDFQPTQLVVHTGILQDRKTYAIPLKIESASDNPIEETGHTALLIYRVDDLEGWYTVERLPKCGENESSYPKGKRRFIKRTGAYTWETGYLFKSYADSENSTESEDKKQFITLNPDTKKIHIQQGSYATSEDLNTFDPITNELHIEYLYTAWAGWWTHERMFNRSSLK